MKYQLLHFSRCLSLTLLMLMAGIVVFGQNYLDKPVTIDEQNRKLGDVLGIVAEQGGFHFSYSSGIIPTDSLVTITYTGEVNGLLHLLLDKSIEYKQTATHIILRPAPFRLTLMPEEVGEKKRTYTIKGYVVDEKTGKGIHNASVYEKRLLSGTLTDKKGHFRLKLKTKDNFPVALTVSKELYKDTTTVFLPTVDIANIKSGKGDDRYINTEGENVSNTAFGRLFLSSRQKINALNIGDFFAYTPVQLSLTPGLSSHGMMSSQVINKFSANLIGGYSAGVDGVEIAGVFNLDRLHVQYVQAAGVLNMVGGGLSGVQLSGVYNTVMDTLKGVQAAGVFNLVGKNASGVQLAGVANGADTLKGVQVAGIVNKAKYNKGFQFGLINVADTSSGVSLGMINWIGNGFKRLSISTNETLFANVDFKSGTQKFYTVVSIGAGTWSKDRIFVTGFGVGREFKRKKQQKGSSYFATELLSHQLLSSRDDNFLWLKGQVLYHHKINRTINFYMGPSINFIHLNKFIDSEPFVAIPFNGYPHLIDNIDSKLWIGLGLGLSFF
ncbi:carboxypeptidase-like regulatory domain-containing protein [Olivibacter sp. SDN3]|uniref:carboxypeptidase-like regulatory domain-containing protein n=1 Tax=Olivibacter sp. SDN3 TaxID=2764720 RepID=UPI001650F3F9|nr:carboxypeptidase-like regulatory domain-containing protein [Olivibacter sp. SDN3]QNL48615.1 carboxypeptidase-like regulatory domain-containing protein [Olivibacter sp. SDN3]